MFCNCSSLKEINFTNINTNNVIDMSYMFNGCSSLSKLNISNFNINNMTNINFIFRGCSTNLSLICTDELLKKEY